MPRKKQNSKANPLSSGFFFVPDEGEDMLHEYSTLNHKIESWTFANAAARTAGIGMSPAPSNLDIGRVGYQSDNGTYWRLMAASPLSWQQIGGGSGGSADGKLLAGNGAPSVGLGLDGDTYFDKTNKLLYGPKAGGSWGTGSSTAGSGAADGKLIIGSGAPASGTGLDGDTYFDKTNKLMYGPKTAGAWGTGTASGNGRFLIGDGAPASGLGVDGDVYFDKTGKAIYGPKAAGAWGGGASTGSGGSSDGKLIVGSGAPSSGTGVDGDTYFDKVGKALYVKSAGAWDAGTSSADGKTIVGDGAPGSGVGVDGDVYIDKVGKAVYGPKASGAWGSGTSMQGPAGPAGTGGDVIYAKAIDSIPADGTPRGLELTALLRSVAHVALPVGTNPWNEFGSPSYRVGPGAPVTVPTFASLVGRNSWITADAGMGDGAVVQLERDSSQGSLGAAQGGALCLIESVLVNGRKGQVSGNDNVVGFNLMCPDRGGEDYIAGHSALHTSKLAATLCHIGINLVAGQYAFHEHWRVGNSDIAVYMSGLNYGGGNVDMPDLRHFNLWGNGVGLAFCPHWNWPVSENRIFGFWAKQCNTAAVAVFWDPAQTTEQADGSQLIIDGGSTEYDQSGKYGEDVTDTYTFPRYNTNAPDESFTVAIPRVDVWVQKWCRVKFPQYAFQSDTNKRDGSLTGPSPGADRGRELVHVDGPYQGHSSSCVWEFAPDPGRSGILVMLDGPSAVLEVGSGCQFPWQQVYSVRARHEEAWVEFQGVLCSAGGIFENVKAWPTAFTMNPNRAPHGNFQFGIVFCGWGGTTKVDNADCPSVLDPAYYTNAYIQAPQLAQGPGIHATTGVTAGTQTEPIPYTYSSTQPVGFFEFAAGVPNALARTQYLMGGSVAVNSGGGWSNHALRRVGGGAPDGKDYVLWQIVNIELYNAQSYAIRIMPYLDNEFTDINSEGQALGCDPALRTHMTKAAVTLWPQQWMRVSIIACPNWDARLNFMRLDHTADTVRVLCRNLGMFRPTEGSRAMLGRALHQGYCSLR